MIFKTKVFQNLMKKSQLTDDMLVRTCQELDKGLVDADLGGYLYKKRIALPGKGKSSGYRTMVGAVIGNRHFFMYLFAKSERSNINKQEKLALRELAHELINFDQTTIRKLLANGELIEVNNHE